MHKKWYDIKILGYWSRVSVFFFSAATLQNKWFALKNAVPPPSSALPTWFPYDIRSITLSFSAEYTLGWLNRSIASHSRYCFLWN